MTGGTATLPVFLEPTTLVGHRGLGKGIVNGQVENTRGSFLAALEAGVDWVEVDVRRTIDNQLFVAHDAFTGSNFMTKMTAQEMSAAGGMRIEELLDALPSSAGVAFDVKSSIEDAGRPAQATTGALLARLGKRSPWRRPALALSFDPASLRHMREGLPALPLGLLTWLRFPVGQAVAAAAHLDVQLLALHAGSLWPGSASVRADVPALEEVVEHVHEADRQLMVWCPNRTQTRALVAAGVDALVVDNVPRKVHVRARVLSNGTPRSVGDPTRPPGDVGS
jgi:glycerophosphoryl diester phosphodiesterase